LGIEIYPDIIIIIFLGMSYYKKNLVKSGCIS